MTNPRRTAALPPLGQPRIMIVGAGLTFLSGISVYTHQLATALKGSATVSAILIRNLLPRRLYPGAQRVGKPLSSLSWSGTDVSELDWNLGRSLVRTLRFLRRQRPRLVVLQWWTAATAHSYLLVALAAKVAGSRVVIEFHEVQDPGESANPALAAYGKSMLRLLVRRSDGFVAHHDQDLRQLRRFLRLPASQVRVAAHPPYSYLSSVKGVLPPELLDADEGLTRFLLFGVMRPRKGLAIATAAFNALPREVAERAELLVVGECWEGDEKEVAKALEGANADRIRVVQRYVSDQEAAAVLDLADVMLLPYTESSSSGPLALALSAGLPVLCSDLESLRVSLDGYADAVTITVGDIPRWTDAMAAATDDWHRGRHVRTPHSGDWTPIVDAYLSFAQGR